MTDQDPARAQPSVSKWAYLAGGIGLAGAVAAMLLLTVFDQGGVALVVLVGMVAFAIIGLLIWVAAKEQLPESARPGRYVVLTGVVVLAAIIGGWVTSSWYFPTMLIPAAAIPLIFGIRARRR